MLERGRKTNSGLLKSCQGSRVIINDDAAKCARLKQQKSGSQPRDQVCAIAALTIAEEEGNKTTSLKKCQSKLKR